MGQLCAWTHEASASCEPLCTLLQAGCSPGVSATWPGARCPAGVCIAVTSGFQCDYSWFLFLFCVFLFTLVWLYFAIIILNDFHNFNE